jgi:hypothetical protein
VIKAATATRRHIAALAALGGVLLLTGTTAPRAADPPLVVVVPSASPMRDISRGNLRRAFLGEPTSGPGGKLMPLNQPPGAAARGQFDRVVLGLEPRAVSGFWIDQRIRGLGGAPRAFPLAVLTRILPQLAGAIGYLRTNEIGPGMKAITIDGKKPGDDGYLLP